jgi:hypothetical protein
MLSVHENFASASIDLELKEQVNVFVGDSGMGKTFLFHLLSSYFVLKGLSYALINQNLADSSEGAIAACCSNVDYVLLDNADLYLTASLLGKIKETAKLVLTSIKNPYGICTDAYRCKINYDGVTMDVH